eukprot:1554772-Pyramimonas_sp.AAC.1
MWHTWGGQRDRHGRCGNTASARSVRGLQGGIPAAGPHHWRAGDGASRGGKEGGVRGLCRRQLHVA